MGFSLGKKIKVLTGLNSFLEALEEDLFLWLFQLQGCSHSLTHGSLLPSFKATMAGQTLSSTFIAFLPHHLSLSEHGQERFSAKEHN